MRFGSVLANAKNLKAQTTKTTPDSAWRAFFTAWDLAIDHQYLSDEQVWIDWGKEVCAPSSLLAHQDLGERRPEMYFWRPCCLNSQYEWSLHGSPARPSLRSHYHTALLRDAVGMTLVTAARSPSRRQGLIYSQYYNKQKEIYDAAKTMPFQDPSIESLALDPHLRRSWQHVGGAETHRPATLVQSYLGSKARCHEGLTRSMQRSFGVREEHRMTLALAYRVRDRLQAMNQWDVPAPEDFTSPPFWRFSSSTFLQFIWCNLNKFTTAFEYVHSLTTRDFVSWEHSKMMICFLRLMKFGYGSHRLRSESALWWDHKDRPRGRTYEGLGFSQTLKQSGYAWFLDKIDWENFTFQAQVTDHTLFGNVAMAEVYRARWREVKNVQDDFLRVEQIGRWFEDYSRCRSIRHFLLEYLIWICLRHFRREVYSSI
jgi:hypothetical protein